MSVLFKKIAVLITLTIFISCSEKTKSEATRMKEWDDFCGEYDFIENRDHFGDKQAIGPYDHYHQFVGKNDTCIFIKRVWVGNDDVVYRSSVNKVKTFAEIKKEKLDIVKGVVVSPDHGGYYETIMRYNPEREELSIIGGAFKLVVSSDNKKSFRTASNENAVHLYKKITTGRLVKTNEVSGN